VCHKTAEPICACKSSSVVQFRKYSSANANVSPEPAQNMVFQPGQAQSRLLRFGRLLPLTITPTASGRQDSRSRCLAVGALIPLGAAIGLAFAR
jgi:hypothetical protein